MSSRDRDPIVHRHGSLEIEESVAAQERLWRVQRVGRIVVLAALAAALAGLCGGGPLSRGTAAAGGHSVQFERITYRDTPQTLHVTIAADALTSGRASVWLPSDTSGWLQMDEVSPPPVDATLGRDRVTYTFATAEGADHVGVRLDFEATRMGVITTQVGIAHGPVFDVWQVVLP